MSGTNLPIYESTAYKVNIGMTKEQVLSSCGSPTSWNRQIINGKTYESINYNVFIGNFDFVDGVLVGYSKRDPFGNLKYFSKDKKEKYGIIKKN